MFRLLNSALFFSIIFATSTHAQDLDNSEWSGSYACRGKETALILRFGDVVEGVSSGEFIFDRPGSNLKGSFAFEAEIDATTGELIAEAGDWIDRPGSAHGWIFRAMVAGKRYDFR